MEYINSRYMMLQYLGNNTRYRDHYCKMLIISHRGYSMFTDSTVFYLTFWPLLVIMLVLQFMHLVFVKS